MNVPSKTLLNLALCLSGTLFVAGCDTRASRSQKAFDQYQAASAGGNLIEMRNALLALTAANEDMPAYWVELGKVQYQLRAYGPAYSAFTRANELNRSDPDILRFLTQIALQSGELEIAQQRASDLDLVAPGDPVVKITNGLIALRRQDYDGALKQAETMLAATPDDPNATILKARALAGLGKPDAAITHLEEHLARQPGDVDSLRALFHLQRRAERWPVVIAIGQRVVTLAPGDRRTALFTIEAALRTNRPDTARAISLSLLKPGTPTSGIEEVLDLWSEQWKGAAPVALAKEFAARASPADRIAYARYLNRAAAPDAALGLVSDQAALAPGPATVDALAVYADSLFRLGRTAEARRRLEAILREDADNVDALGTMALVLLRVGDKSQAVNVARKLVAVDPVTVDNRFILARVLDESGDRDSARRALWDGFHDIPASERLYTALRAYLGNDSDAKQRLDDEYADQRDRKLMQDSQ